MNTITNIDQAGIKALLRERLEQPELYVGKPLIIWCAYFRDGIQEVLIRDVLKTRNAALDKDAKLGFKVNPTREPKNFKGFCIIDAFEDYTRSLGVINGCPVVVYAAEPEDAVLEQFPGAEQYVFTPDFEQWASTLAKSNRFLADFIKGGKEQGLPSRWYNYFNNPLAVKHREGCDFPSVWLKGLAGLRSMMRLRKVKKLNDVVDDRFDTWFAPRVSPQLISELREYIIDSNL